MKNITVFAFLVFSLSITFACGISTDNVSSVSAEEHQVRICEGKGNFAPTLKVTVAFDDDSTGAIDIQCGETPICTNTQRSLLLQRAGESAGSSLWYAWYVFGYVPQVRFDLPDNAFPGKLASSFNATIYTQYNITGADVPYELSCRTAL